MFPTNAAMSSDQAWNACASSIGTPSSSQMIRVGSGNARAAISSGAGSSAISSKSSSTISVIREFSRRASAGVKVVRSNARIRVCCGGSVKPSQLPTCFATGAHETRSSGVSAVTIPPIRSLARRGSSNPARTSSYRVITQASSAGLKCTGSWSRSHPSSGYGSSRRPSQNCAYS